MTYRVVFAPEATEQLAALYTFISTAASPSVASRYTMAIIDHCEGLATFPLRGTRRDDVRPGLRTTNYKKRVVIAYGVDVDVVSILGVYYGGQDYDTLLQDES